MLSCCGIKEKPTADRWDENDFWQLQGEKIMVDDYEIMMTKAIYDDMNYGAQCEFYVMKNHGKEKVAYKDRHNVNDNNYYFGEDERFRFMQNTGTGMIISDIDFEEKGNILKMNYTLSIDSDFYDGRLHLFDNTCGLQEGVENCTQYFVLKPTEEHKKFVLPDNDTTIYLSSMSLRITSETAIDESAMSVWINENSGVRYDVITEGKMAKGISDIYSVYSDKTLLYSYEVMFHTLIDVSQVQSVYLNGVEYR